MESFQFDDATASRFEIVIEETSTVTPELAQTLVDIDLQTFSESTYSYYTAAAFLRNGKVFLLRAIPTSSRPYAPRDTVIGSCVCMRVFDSPNEVMVLSMGIRPGWRGRGLGQEFISGVLDGLRKAGHRHVSLMVGEDNRRAIKVYRDVGFDIVERGPSDPRTGETLLMMRLKLAEDQLISLPGHRDDATREED